MSSLKQLEGNPDGALRADANGLASWSGSMTQASDAWSNRAATTWAQHAQHAQRSAESSQSGSQRHKCQREPTRMMMSGVKGGPYYV